MRRPEDRSDSKIGPPPQKKKKKTPPVPNVVNLDESPFRPDPNEASSKRDRAEIDADEAYVRLQRGHEQVEELEKLCGQVSHVVVPRTLSEYVGTVASERRARAPCCSTSYRYGR